jgi:hypothetical protein
MAAGGALRKHGRPSASALTTCWGGVSVCRRASVSCQGWCASTGVGTCARECAGCVKHRQLRLQKMGSMKCEHWQGLSLQHTAEAGHQALAA